MLDKFGLGQRTGVGLPGESAGLVPPIDQWSGSTFSNLPIGQGLSMTLLQMTGMYQAIANDGVRIPPRIVKATIAPDGTRTEEPRPDGVRVVSPQTAQTVRNMLRAVVQRDPMGIQQGTGSLAAVEGYQISGKTGTAQQINPACGCYYSDVYWITFAGMVTTDNPRYVIGIMADNPHRTADGTAGHDDGAAVPQHRQLAAAAGEHAAVARPGPAADAAGHLTAGVGRQARPVLCHGHEAASLASRRPGARATGRPGRRGHHPPHGGARETVVTGVTLRSQDAQPGDLFAALPGASSHGGALRG